MRGIRATIGIACVVVGLFAQAAQAQPAGGSIVGLQLDGVVDPFVADHIAGDIRRAVDDGASAVLLEIDTPGGLDSSMRQITQAILNSTVPVVCYVSPQGARAASAGAFVLMSCPVAAMAPGTNVGASTPVGIEGGDLSTKIENDATAYMRSLTETYGRNADETARFVTEGASISAEEALAANVIDTISPTREQLLQELDGQTVRLGTGQSVQLRTAGIPIVDRSLGGFLGFLHELFNPNTAFLFFWLGLALIVLELLVPGHIFSGTVGTILLLTSIVSFGLLPVRWIGIALLVLSVIAFVIELHAPGIGIWGGVGTIALVLGGWFLFDRSGGVAVSPLVILPTAAVIALFFGFVVAKVIGMRSLPPAQGAQAIIGKTGTALGYGVDARGGVVRVAAEEWKAVSKAGTIAPGTPVRVVSLDGLVLTVENVPLEHTEAASAAQEGGKS